MRTGTHLLIDLVLNNFPAYRNRPLYVDLDQYLASELPAESLFSCGACVIKTHFPQTEIDRDIVSRLAGQSHIIRTNRNTDDTYRSLVNFGYEHSFDRFAEEKEHYNRFWNEFDSLQVDFKALTTRDQVPSIISRIAQMTDSQPLHNPVLPCRRDEVAKVLMIKLATRLLGRRSPSINTTILFAADDKPRGGKPEARNT